MKATLAWTVGNLFASLRTVPKLALVMVVARVLTNASARRGGKDASVHHLCVEAAAERTLAEKMESVVRQGGASAKLDFTGQHVKHRVVGWRMLQH